jgi:hypothetical protein
MTNPLDMSGTLSLGTPSVKLAPKQRKALRMAIEMLTTVYRGKRIYETEQLMRVADFCQEALDQAAEEQIQEQVSRLEVIDAEGRSYTNWLVTKLKLSYQDEDKTLKIFTDGASETKYTKPLVKSWESKCKCDFRTKLVGDGCQYCNTEEYIDKLSGDYDDLLSENESLREEIAKNANIQIKGETK